MPMGFKNSPAVFQRYMDQILRTEIGRGCWIYVDDLIIYGKTEQEHDDALIRIKDILDKNNLQINEKKSVYKQKEMEFLGHYISKDQIRKALDSVEIIKNYARPKTRKDIQKFMGLVNHYRKFMKNMSIITEPLYNLLKKQQNFICEMHKNQQWINLKRHYWNIQY